MINHAIVRFLIRSTTDVYPGSKKFYLSRVLDFYDVYVRDIRNNVYNIYNSVSDKSARPFLSHFFSSFFFYPFPLRI